MLVAGAMLVFPKLALGLSGFETGVSVMPLIDGGEADRDTTRVTAARRRAAWPTPGSCWLTAAAIMSVHAAPLELRHHAADRARPNTQPGGKAPAAARIAFLAHAVSRPRASARSTTSRRSSSSGSPAPRRMAGLLHLIPRYLPRFGMAPRWVALARPLVLVLFARRRRRSRWSFAPTWRRRAAPTPPACWC